MKKIILAGTVALAAGSLLAGCGIEPVTTDGRLADKTTTHSTIVPLLVPSTTTTTAHLNIGTVKQPDHSTDPTMPAPILLWATRQDTNLYQLIADKTGEISVAASHGDLVQLAVDCHALSTLYGRGLTAYKRDAPPDPVVAANLGSAWTYGIKGANLCSSAALAGNASQLTASAQYMSISTDAMQKVTARLDVLAP